VDYPERKVICLSVHTNSHSMTPIRANTDPVSSTGTQLKAEGPCPTEFWTIRDHPQRDEWRYFTRFPKKCIL